MFKKKGKWKDLTPNAKHVYCSQCNLPTATREQVERFHYQYCPYCGSYNGVKIKTDYIKR